MSYNLKLQTYRDEFKVEMRPKCACGKPADGDVKVDDFKREPLCMNCYMAKHIHGRIA